MPITPISIGRWKVHTESTNEQIAIRLSGLAGAQSWLCSNWKCNGRPTRLGRRRNALIASANHRKDSRRDAQPLTERNGTTAFADITGVGSARASHLVGRNPSRNIGHKMARRIERAFGKPEGWLDADHARSIGAAVNRLLAFESPYDYERERGYGRMR
jgi:hypothetical protein